MQISPSMELHLFSLPLLLAFFIFLLVLIKNKTRSQKGLAPPPPGPSKLPIIGSIHHVMGAGLPHHVLRDLAAKYGPVMHLKLGQIDLVVISSPAAAQEVTKTHDLKFASRLESLPVEILSYGYSGIIFTPYSNHWREMRKICTVELLSARRVRKFGYLRDHEISLVIESITAAAAAKSPVNLTPMILSLANNTIAKAVFGKACEQKERFISALAKASTLLSGFNLADLFPNVMLINSLTGYRSKLLQLLSEWDDILNEIIRDHQVRLAAAGLEEPDEENIVDVLFKLKDNGGLQIPLTENDVKAVVLDMFAAGTDTSSATVLWAMAELMKHPKVMQKVQEEVRNALKGKVKIEESDINELHYLKQVIKETLRLHPIIPFLVRRGMEASTVGGFMIAPGSRVFINVWAISRDPKIWDDAESFKPERFEGSSIDFRGSNYEFLPFGAGRRMCPGITFGLANVDFTIAHLLLHFNWALPFGMTSEDVDMDEIYGATVRRKGDLYLLPTPYSPSIVV